MDVKKDDIFKPFIEESEDVDGKPIRLIFLKGGGVMDIEEWVKIPAEGTSKTEDIECEIIQHKIENK